MIMNTTHAALTGVLAHEAAKELDNVEKSPDEICNKLDIIIQHLQSIDNLLQSPVAKDIYKIVQLSKTDLFGPAYIPRAELHDHIWILTGLTTPLSIQSSMLGTFVFTVSPGIWTLIDFPDGTSYRLDNSATPNQQYVYIRFTNDDNSR